MSTVFKWKNRYVRGERLFWGYVYIEGHGILNSFQGIIEKKALQEFRYQVRIREESQCYNVVTQKMTRLHKNQRLTVRYPLFDGWQDTFLVCENGSCINPRIHAMEKMKCTKPLMVQIIDTSGAVVRETVEDNSRPWGIARFGAILLIETVELCMHSPWRNHLRLKLYHQPGYIYKSAVRLLGHADGATARYYNGGDIEIIGSAITTPRNCIICQDKCTDATFVHGDLGHTVCCFACALQAFEKDRRCPICRVDTERVILNIAG